MSEAWPYPEPLDDGGARHLLPGRKLPSIALPSTVGEAVDISRLRGGTVLFIYPWTGRPDLPNPPGWDIIPGAHGSTPEVQGFCDLYPRLCARGYAVFGLSAQDTAHQQELAERLQLPFALLSDEALTFGSALRLPTFVTGGVTYLQRLTLVIGDGLIVRTFYPVHPPHTHAAVILAEIEG